LAKVYPVGSITPQFVKLTCCGIY